MELKVHGSGVSIGWLIALLVLIACFIVWLAVAHVTPLMLIGLIAGLAVAYLVG